MATRLLDFVTHFMLFMLGAIYAWFINPMQQKETDIPLNPIVVMAPHNPDTTITLTLDNIEVPLHCYYSDGS